MPNQYTCMGEPEQMTRDELRDLLIEAKALIRKLERIWQQLDDVELEACEIGHLVCDSCEDKK